MPKTVGAVWERQGAEKREPIRELFARIAPNYDKLNGLLSLNLHHRWRAFAVRQLQLKPGDSALDLCCGTGDFFRPLRAAIGDGRLIGLDFCQPMLEIARRKHQGNGGLLLADACRLPIASSSMDGVTIGWGLRNVVDVDQVHREAARVLKSGARFVSLDMARPTNRFVRAASSAIFRRLAPAVGALVGLREDYTYLPESSVLFRSRDQLKESMLAAGFQQIKHRDLMLGNLCIMWGVKA